MADSAIYSVSSFRSQFTTRAEAPERQLAEAARFTHLLETHLRDGITPSVQDVEQGRAALAALDGRIEDWAFAATVIAGQSAADEAELDRQLDTLIHSVEYAQMTSSKLSQVLANVSA